MVTKVIHGEINASARIIGDISLGIYRSPANALKELVSNAFDVGATEVIINTDHPAFTYVSCYDNGSGIGVEELREVFKYIGGSDKRLRTNIGPYRRPIIGKIGIGILGMSQISKRFVIISSRAGENTRLLRLCKYCVVHRRYLYFHLLVSLTRFNPLDSTHLLPL